MKTISFFLLAALILAASSAVAQTASIVGTVSDPTGAVVSGAAITVQNTETGAVRTIASGDTGFYSVTNLEVGKYQIEVKKQNFATSKMSSITLTVDQTLTANVTLKPGAVTEEVNVSAAGLPLVDLESSQVSNVVESKQMKDLPLILRDPYQLVFLSPGAAQTNAYGGVSVNGSRERNNNFMLDGVDNNDTSVPGGVGGVLSANPDSTEEFRIITNNFDAEFGRNTGAIIDAVTKSGTNQFHGDAYWFGRWNGFGGARDWFNPAANGPMNPYVRNQFGYSIGGPIIKSKTFFFFNEEFNRFRTTLTSATTVPTAAFKSGVFTYNDGVDAAQTVDLLNANNAYGLPADPTMQNLFALYPKATVDDGNGYSGTLFYQNSSKLNLYNITGKIDHRFSDRQVLSLRYGYDHSFDPDPFFDAILPGGIGETASKSINQGLSAQFTSTFTNTLVNNFQFGWNHIYATFNCTNRGAFDSLSPADKFGNTRDYLIDPFASIGCTSLAANNQGRKTGTTSYGDNLTWVHGNHTLKFGVDFRDVGENGADNFFSRRQVNLQGFVPFGDLSLLTGVVNTTGGPDVALEDAAWAFYGLVYSDLNAEFFNKTGTRVGSNNRLFRQHEYDWFGQDSWKIRRNLTLSLGLRYQLDGVPYEENANFSNLLTSPASFPVVMSIVGPGTGKQIYNSDYSNIEPRVGFSWDPWKNGKTAIRGGFGIFHDRVFGNLFGNARGNPPFEQDWQQFPGETINNAFGSGAFPVVVPDTTPSQTIADHSYLAPVIISPHFRNPVSNNWSLGIQRELPGNNAIDLAYVGSEGHHIFRQMDGNPPDPALVASLVAYCSVPNPYNCTRNTVQSTNLYYGGDFGSLPYNAVDHNALLQPSYQVSVGNANYNSLQAKFTHRMSHGVQVQASYTWSHALDDSSDPLAPAQGNRTFPRNSRNLAQEYGNSDNDVRHIGVINYIWELPIGQGKGSLSNGFVGRVLEGMQISGLARMQTGHPFEVRSRRDSQGTGISAWASLAGNPYAAGSNSNAPNGKGYFTNPGAFVTPAFGGPGTVGRNQFYGPSFVDFDMVFAKHTKLSERFDLETRVECYNVFNHPEFQVPDNLMGDPTFGVITATLSQNDGTTTARQMQVSMKLNF